MRFTRILQKKIQSRILLSFLALFLVSFLDFAYASQLRIVAPTTIYQWCVQPYVVTMDTNGITTKSVDTKLFLTGYFTLGSPYTTISSALLTQTGYANYIPWSFQVTTLQTGVASTWTHNNRQYLYINTYQSFGSPSMIGNNIPIAILYLRANNFTTWYLDFYYNSNRNGDDSNISSGINQWVITGSFTQYVDSLTGVTNLSQTISPPSRACISKPYISSAVYRQTWYISTSTGVQAVWTSVVAWPEYSGTSGRTVWTRWGVLLALTGVADGDASSWALAMNNLSTWIQFTHAPLLDNPFIYSLTTATWWFTQYYVFRIIENISTGFAWFDNIIGNTGSTYLTGGQKYVDPFYIDIFWIDQISPVNTGYFTGYVAGTGVWYTQYTLSWSNYTGPGPGWNAAWTTADDEYKVISFSGTNSVTQDCTNKWYACTNVWYMAYLNSTWYVRSGNNIFKLIHNLVFTTSFSWYVTVMDRAWNTGQWNINVNMDNLIVVNYWLLAYPQAWVARNQLISLSGMLIKLAIYSWWFDKSYLLSWLIYTGFIKTSNTGRANFTGNFASWTYQVLAEGMDTLAYLLTWVSLSPAWWTIDYTQTYTWGFLFGDTYGIVTTLWSKHASYLSDWANRDSIVNVADLANLVTIRWEFGTIDTNPNIGVYSGSYFVDKPSNGTGYKIIPYSLLQSTGYSSTYMQYHPYDLNANGLVDVNDYSLANGNYNKTWATYWWKLNWISPATMPF